ncbi:MAG: hypothetical protein ACSLFR_09305 [Solirubrobacteraceae bacterium]
MFARAPQPPIFAPEGMSWEFPSRADRDSGAAPDDVRLGGARSGGRRATLAPAARQAASAARGAAHGVAAIARDLLLLADPELEARAEQLARAEDSSGSRAGDSPASCAGRQDHARVCLAPRRPRRPGTPPQALDPAPCLTPRSAS